MPMKKLLFLLLGLFMLAPPDASAIIINNPDGTRVWFQNLPPGEVSSGDSTIITILNQMVAPVNLDAINIGGTTTDTLHNTASVKLQFAVNDTSGYYILFTEEGERDTIFAADGITMELTAPSGSTLSYFYVDAQNATRLFMIRSWYEDADE
jgi:hypothetical protein